MTFIEVAEPGNRFQLCALHMRKTSFSKKLKSMNLIVFMCKLVKQIHY